MSEWPKTPDDLVHPDERLPAFITDEPLVLADLARELYESLVHEITRQGGPLLVEERRAKDPALIRYEREVGK